MDDLDEYWSSYPWAIEDVKNESERAFMRQQLKEFNNRVSPHHMSVRSVPPRALDIFMRDRDGAIAGGITTATFWGWLDIDTLWIAEDLRGRGFGERPLGLAESESLRRGCRYARVDTYSFQARGFYEKQGYRV